MYTADIMTQIISWALFLLSIIIAAFYMLKVRRAGAQDPMMADGLTVGERVLIILTILFGGVIIGGSIYYYGWKKRFPVKARQTLHIEWVFIALFFIVFLGGGYLYYNYVVVPNAQQQGQALYEQVLQQQQLQQGQSGLNSNPSQTPIVVQGNPVQSNTSVTQSPPKETPAPNQAPTASTKASATIDKASLSSTSSTFTVTGTASNLNMVLVEFNGNGSGGGGGTYPVINGRWTATLTGVSGDMGVVVYPPDGQGTPLASGRFVYAQ